MNAPTVAVAAVLGWYAFTADSPGLATVAGVLFVLVLLWAVVAILDSWRVLHRFIRREAHSRSRGL